MLTLMYEGVRGTAEVKGTVGSQSHGKERGGNFQCVKISCDGTRVNLIADNWCFSFGSWVNENKETYSNTCKTWKNTERKKKLSANGFLRYQNDSNYRNKKKNNVAAQQKVNLKLDDAIIEESILLYNWEQCSNCDLSSRHKTKNTLSRYMRRWTATKSRKKPIKMWRLLRSLKTKELKLIRNIHILINEYKYIYIYMCVCFQIGYIFRRVGKIVKYEY
jgi:hypothetical protein